MNLKMKETPTPIQDLIEQNVASGGFFYRSGNNLNRMGFLLPEYLQDSLKGLRVHLTNLEYKSGNLIPEHDRDSRRNSYICWDYIYGMLIRRILFDSDRGRAANVTKFLIG